MTQPSPTSPFGSVTEADQRDALDSINSMLTGSKMLREEPGVVYALAQSQARPQDAGAIDQFMQALDAEKMVDVTRAGLATGLGHKIILDTSQKRLLTATGVPYQDILYTKQDAASAAAAKIEQESNGAKTVERNRDGTIALDKHGQIKVVDAVVPGSSDDGGNWFTDAVGAVGGAFESAGGAVLHKLTQAYDFVQSVAAPHGFQNPFSQQNQDDPLGLRFAHSDYIDQKDAGYGDSIWDTLAFDASGKRHTDLTDLLDKHGEARVQDALKFLDDPGAYRKSIEQNSAYFTTLNGRTALTPAGSAKLAYLNSSEFEDLTKRIAARSATFGDDLANAIGFDPLTAKAPWSQFMPDKLPGGGTDRSAFVGSTNLVASFLADPTLLALRAHAIAKTAQVGVDWLGDANRAADILTRPGRLAGKVQSQWNRAIELGGQMRKAHEDGDAVAAAKLERQFQVEIPQLSPLMPEFIGKQGLTGWRNATDAERASGAHAVLPVYGDTGGIRSLDDAAEFITNRSGLLLLHNGRAAVQSSVMPGYVSSVGYRRLRGSLSGWLSKRSAVRGLGQQEELLSRADADPLLRDQWISDKILREISARPNDAVDPYSNAVLAYPKADSASHALGNLMGLMREASPAEGEHAAFLDELDSLEEKLQGLMVDKTATPEQLADAHDAIQTGRELVDASERGLLPVRAEVKAAQAKLATAEKLVTDDNGARAEYENVAADKTPSGPLNMPSAKRGYEITPAGLGFIENNMRREGNVAGDLRALGRMNPHAVAARARLAVTRLSSLLPRNTEIDILDPLAGDKIYKIARTYLDRGNAGALRAAWNFGNAGERKAIVTGLIDQLGHAAGLGRGRAGREFLDHLKVVDQNYSTVGDEVELVGSRQALFEGQTRQKWTLPTFQQWQHVADKNGLWDATMGRAFTSSQMDEVVNQWKYGALLKPSTVTRNMLEGWLRTMLEGRAGEAVKARALATAKNKELWDRGFGLADRDAYVAAQDKVDTLEHQLGGSGLTDKMRVAKRRQLEQQQAILARLSDKTVVRHHLAVQAGDTGLAAELESESLLAGDLLGRSKPATRLAELAPLAWVGRAYRSLVGDWMDAETVDALMTLGPEDLQRAMEGYGQQILSSDLGFKNAAQDATLVAKAGHGPAQLNYSLARAKSRGAGKRPSETTAWKLTAIDDSVGADRYSNALHQRIDAMPETARATIAYLSSDVRGDIEPIVSALEKESKSTAFGRVYFEDPTGMPNVARPAVNPAEIAAGKRDWAHKVINEYAYLLHGRNGEFQKELAEYVTRLGHAPDGDWIVKHMLGGNRPEAALAPEVMATPNGGIRSALSQFQDVEGGIYQWMVERPLQRTTSSPVFLANYALARKSLNSAVDDLVESGLSRESAEAFAKNLAIQNAWVKTEQLIDDPGLKTQFDVIARNFFPFSRATQAMIRRWGTGLWQNPVAARKMMLAYEGAVHSGVIYTNLYGEPTFTYPGSGVLNMGLREVAKIPGFERFAEFPVSSDMTGGVLMSVPGADNPFRMSMGPMISVPLREIYKHILPTAWRGDALAIDATINGPIGAGETFSQFAPTAVRRFYQAFDSDQRNSAMASAMQGALANLMAAGMVPPPDASPAERQEFMARLQAQVKSQLFLRAIFGLVAPAAPSQPVEGTNASGADYAWSIDGIHQLSDEYKEILNETGGDVGRTTAIFTALHPDQVVYKQLAGGEGETSLTASAYETAHTKSNPTGVYLPATNASFEWLNSHGDFVKRYSSVAAYFLPAQTGHEPFSDAAYQVELELGLRQRKTPTEFRDDVYVKHAESMFYPTVQQYDDKIAAATNAGDTTLAASLRDQKSAWEKEYEALNPLFKAKLDNYPASRSTAEGQLADLRVMTQAGHVPDGLGDKLSTLIKAYDNYTQFAQVNKGDTDAIHAGLTQFNTWASWALHDTPLAQVYDGVFRVLNTNFVEV